MDKRKEIQNQQAFDPENKQAYGRLFDLLNESPKDTISQDIAERVIRRIQRREKIQSIWFVGLAGLGVVFSTLATLLVLGYYFGTENLSQLMDVTGWGVFAGVTIVLIQFLDRKLVHKKSWRPI